MAKSKLSLENSSLTWSEKRRYKVNAVVLYSGSNYQNLTGKNSEPGVGSDWFKVPDTSGGGGGPVSTDTVTNNSNVAGATATDALNNLQAQFPGDYSQIVYVNNNNPNSATIFDLNNPPATNDPLLEEDDSNLYIGLDESSWVYNSVSLVYETETGTGGKATSNFVLEGTNKDAGNNKNSAIERSGPVGVGTATKPNHAVTKAQHDKKENTSNKTGTVIGNEASTSLYLHILGAVTYFQQKLTDSIFGAFINGLTGKTIPIDADSISIVDSADSNKQKKVSLTNFKAFLKAYFDGLYAVPKITITTSVSITTATTDSSGLGQNGRHVAIDNGVNAINITCNGGVTASYGKTSTGVITFVQGSGRTLVQLNGTTVLNGIAGSSATLWSNGTTDYLSIINY